MGRGRRERWFLEMGHAFYCSRPADCGCLFVDQSPCRSVASQGHVTCHQLILIYFGEERAGWRFLHSLIPPYPSSLSPVAKGRVAVGQPSAQVVILSAFGGASCGFLPSFPAGRGWEREERDCSQGGREGGSKGKGDGRGEISRGD